MPTLNFHIKYQKDTSQIISADEFKKMYLYGIDLNMYGKVLDDSVFDFWIAAATQQVEDYLNVKIRKQIFTEKKDFHGDDWRQWGYINTMYPVVLPLALTGFLGSVQQIKYPRQWISSSKTSDGRWYQRRINLVANTGSNHSEVFAASGLIPNLGPGTYGNIPDYWNLSYVTGFDKIPADILAVIGKLSAIQILAVASDGMMPGGPGVASNSISLDGLSQSISSVASGQNGIFGARIKQYGSDLFGDRDQLGELKRLRGVYQGVVLGVL